MICKLYHWQIHASGFISAYLVSTLALDRVIAIKYPIWHRNHASRNLVNKLAGYIVIFSYVFNSAVLYFFNLDKTTGNSKLQGDLNPLIRKIYSGISSLIYFTVPIFFLVYANIVFITTLINRKKIRNASNAQKFQSKEKAHFEKERSDSERSYVLMLIWLSVTFTITFFFTTLMNLAILRLSSSKIQPDIISLEVLRNCLAVLVAWNNSLNFVFYWLSGAMFRRALKKAILKKLRREQI